jgi:unsaturated rhamnogalacturonyl hydrolase
MRYSAAAARVLGLYDGIPTNTQGGYWHKNKYPNEIWLDGLYMAEPFLARYGAANSDCGDFCFAMPVFQMSLLAEHVRLPSGLFLHGWDEDKNAAWCSGDCKGTGLSPEVWSRAMGWFAMALVDTLKYLPDTHAERPTLEQLLQELAEGVAANQDSASGLWCQVVDKCNDSANWLESSGSAMLIYALKRGVEMGVLDNGYLTVALDAWNGLIENMISKQGSQPVIAGAAKGMSIQSSYDAYTAIPRLSNSAHGLCAVLLAAAAMEY